MRLWIGGIAATFLLSLASAARADSCTAPLPARTGQTFSGPVRYVGDGDSLCVGRSRNPATWIEVRLADFDAAELHAAGGARAKALLTRVALGRTLVCTAEPGRSGRVIVYDRVIAACTLGGRRLGDVLRSAGGIEAKTDARRLVGGIARRSRVSHGAADCRCWGEGA